MERLETRNLFAGLVAEEVVLPESDSAKQSEVYLAEDLVADDTQTVKLEADGIVGDVTISSDKIDWADEGAVFGVADRDPDSESLKSFESFETGEEIPQLYFFRTLSISEDGTEYEFDDAEMVATDLEIDWDLESPDVIFYSTMSPDDAATEASFILFNADNIADTNWDGEVSPIDVLITSNAIQKFGSVELTVANIETIAASYGGQDLPYALDANNDGYLSPADVGVRVNRLNVLAEAAVAPLASTLAARWVLSPDAFLIVDNDSLSEGDRTWEVDANDSAEFDAGRIMGIAIGELLGAEDAADQPDSRNEVTRSEVGDEAESWEKIWVAEEIDSALLELAMEA